MAAMFSLALEKYSEKMDSARQVLGQSIKPVRYPLQRQNARIMRKGHLYKISDTLVDSVHNFRLFAVLQFAHPLSNNVLGNFKWFHGWIEWMDV
jgi:hypothetical protein